MPSPDRKLRVFLCHASQDKPMVRELYYHLMSEGWIDVWLDEIKLLPGQEWDIEIEKAVEQADVVIVSLSNQSVDKEGYVQKELRFVLNIAEEKPEATIFVIPLRLDDCTIPRRIRNWQYVDYFPKGYRKIAYQRVLKSLKLRAAKLGISMDKAPLEKGSTIIIGDGVTQSPPAQNPERAKETQKVESLPRKTTAPKFDFRWLGIGGIVLFVLLLGAYSLIHLPTTPKPSSTTQATSTFELPSGTLGIGSTMFASKDGMRLLYIPAGNFLMGSSDKDTLASPDEKPQHTVFLDAFWIDQTDVTNAMYSKCVNAGACKQPTNLL